MKKEITTKIIIQASPEKIWAILMDFENYSNWNPFIKFISGKPIVGNKLTVKIQPPESSIMTFKPTIITCTENIEFKWLGNLLIPGLFDGEHRFQLIGNADESTTFIHSEKFNGILVPIFTKMLDTKTLEGFKLMNEALKNKAEK